MWRPRTFWPMRTNRLPSENWITSPAPGSTARCPHTALVRIGLADPPNTRRSSTGSAAHVRGFRRPDLVPDAGEAAATVEIELPAVQQAGERLAVDDAEAGQV